MIAVRRPQPGVILAALAVLIVCAAVRCCVLAALYDGDMELFVYMGKLAGEGGRVGVELLDNKLPTVGLLMWLPYKAIGAWWPGYAWLGIASAVVAVWAIARAAAGVHTNSLWPTAAIAGTWMSFPLAVFSAFKLEHVTLTTSSLAAWAFVRCWRAGRAADALAVGVFAGVGMLAKPNGLAVFAAAVFAAGVSSASWRSKARIVLWMTGGLSIVLVVTLAYLVGTGAMAGMGTAFEQIRSYNRNSVWHPQAVAFKSAFVAAIGLLPLLMRSVLERRRGEEPRRRVGTVWAFASAWLVVEVAGAAMQGRLYGYHFLPLAAPAALLFGLIPRRPMAISVIGSAVPVLMVSVFWVWESTLATARPADRLAAIDFVKTHAAPGDGVWMDEYARLLVESNLRAGSRVPLTFIFSNDDQAPAKFGGMILDDLRSRRPKWVVLPTDPLGRAHTQVERRAEYAERPARGEAYVEAWRRIDARVRAEYRPVAAFGEQTVYERHEAIVSAEP